MSQWISVEIALPENTNDVLVSEGCDVFVGWNAKPSGQWKNSDGNLIFVTHWMPLPEPPTL